MSPALSYQDVLLVPNYSELDSRSLADTSVDFLGKKFKLPVVPANMLSVIDVRIARFLSTHGYFYIYHRFGVGAHQLDTESFLYLANREKWNLISASLGVNNKDLPIIDAIAQDDLRVDFITIDVAHAHHSKVRDRIKLIKEKLPNVKLIVGNIATPQAVIDVVKWGADAVKIGIGQGSICTTRFQTGFSVPMFSCVQSCTDTHYWESGRNYVGVPSVPVIADGGVETIGDIAKALVAGADMVMCGGLFARCSDSPAEIKHGFKTYFGSTSYEAKGHRNHIEGKAIDVPVDVSYLEKLQEIQQALQSAISYAGGKDLSAFRNVAWIKINR